jgi:hypothetical protein
MIRGEQQKRFAFGQALLLRLAPADDLQEQFFADLRALRQPGVDRGTMG